MIGYFRSQLNKKRKEAHERELKEKLARKFENFDEMQSGIDRDKTDYTIIEIGGKALSVAKEQITIFNIDAPPLEV